MGKNFIPCMILSLIIFLSALFFILFIIEVFGEYFDKELPKGYSFLCSTDKEKIAIQFPDGTLSVRVWDNKHLAASFARYYERHKNDPIIIESEKYSWEKCE